MNKTNRDQRATWRRLRAGWPRSRTAASEPFVQSVMDRVHLEAAPAGTGGWVLFRRAFHSGAARWSLAAGALAVGLFLLRPPVATVPPGAVLLSGDPSLPWEEESSAGYGTDVEEYLL